MSRNPVGKCCPGYRDRQVEFHNPSYSTKPHETRMTNKPGQDDEQSLVAKISADFRRLLISGEFAPGEKL